jgi:hypothetical protein
MKHGGKYKNNLKIWEKGNQKPSFDEAQTLESLKKKHKKKPNNDLQNTTQKSKDRAKRIPLNTGEVLRRGKQLISFLQ